MGAIKFPHSSGNSMAIASPATNPASDLELKLPATVGTANQVLKNSGTAGTLEFGDAGLPSGLTYGSSTLAVTGKQTISAQPAFRASVTSNTAATNTIVFNSQQYEQGGDNYDPTTGIYTCPVAGLYMFIAQCMSTASTGNKAIELVKNSDAIGRAMAGMQSDSPEHQMLPLTVVQQFAANDTVKVVVTSGNIYGSTGGNSQYSQFMGYLLG